ncbi:MAG TPA: Rrf2 family transcriptional regulator [bacterium]|nr:Rrf2 family transcriptional regulator [bacterium]
MARFPGISDAASLALHALSLFAKKHAILLSTREVAELLDVSEAHLAKVLQRLNRSGLVVSVRGPGGGFTLAKPAEKVTLLEVYEAIEGPMDQSTCLLRKPVCPEGKCILGDLLKSMNAQVKDRLSQTTLADAAGSFGSERE